MSLYILEKGFELKVSQTPLEVRVGSNIVHHVSFSLSSFVSCDKELILKSEKDCGSETALKRFLVL